MFKTIQFFIILCVFAFVSSAPAATRKTVAKEKEAESALSPALAKPVAAAMDSLQALLDPAQKNKAKRPAAAIRRADGLKADLKTALAQLREVAVDRDEAAAKDAAVVAVASALRAADLVSQGLQEQDDDQVKAGLKLAELAQADLQGLDESGDETQGPAAASSDYKIGPSMGGNLSLSSQGGSTNMSADLSISFPLSQAMDLGVGGSLSGSNSSSGSGLQGSSSSSLGYGFNAFTRYHFLELFSAAPWIVPYIGLKIGLNSTENFSTQGYNVSDTTTNSTTLGEQLGVLFFINAKSAITAQIENSVASNTSAGTSSPSTNSLTLSMGVRQMF